MEKDEIELIDYFRVIWKRKILIIVGTLVCIVIGAAVSLRLPVTYRADAVMKIGKKVELQLPSSSSSSSSSSSLVYLDTPAALAKSIPVKYGQNIKEGIGFHLDADVISGTSMIRITLKGPDRRTEKFLKEIVNRIIDEHLRMTERSVLFYKTLIERREKNISEIRKGLAQVALELEEMSIENASVLKETNKDLDKEMGVDLDKAMGIDIDKTDPLALMIIRNKIIETQNIKLRRKESARNTMLNMKQIARNNLRQSGITIRSIQDDIFLCQLTIDTLRENKTRLVGEVKNTAIEPKKKRNIILAGVVGLMMSLFLAFFIEYVGKTWKNGKDNSF